MDVARAREMKRNFQAFEGLLAELVQKNAGQFALMSNGELVGVYPDAFEALRDGDRRFGDGNFSVQRIVTRPLDLGFLSYASSERDTH